MIVEAHINILGQAQLGKSHLAMKKVGIMWEGFKFSPSTWFQKNVQ